MSTKRVLAAVSGGVDSSVAVHLLRQQGYEVEGVILEFSPAHRAAVESARVIAEQMKMPLHVIECHREFEENVILPFCREYREGRTPNPCILCNPSTKFALICKAAADILRSRFMAAQSIAAACSTAAAVPAKRSARCASICKATHRTSC